MADDSRSNADRDARRSSHRQRTHSSSQTSARKSRYNAQSQSHRSSQHTSSRGQQSSSHRAKNSQQRGTRNAQQAGRRKALTDQQRAAADKARKNAHQAVEEQERIRTSAGKTAEHYSSDNYSARNKGMSTGKKVAIGVVCTLLVALAGLGIAAAVWYGNIASNIKGNTDITNLVAPAANEPYYVLLMGSDAREGWEPVDDYNSGERSDSIMVARVDEKNQKVSIISVPRDLRVKIDGHGYQKINSTIEYGGYNLLINKLNEILGIKINYYATVYFTGFLDLVDTLGGVTVEVPEGTADYNEDETKPDIILPVGDEVTLDGRQALVLARCRHGWPIDQGAYAMGDYQRTLNQRNLIKAIAKKVLVQDITMMPALIESLSKSIETNMGVDKIIALAQNMKGMDVESMESAQLPIGASTIGGEWEAIMYQDVFEVMAKNFKNGDPLFLGLDNFNFEANDDDVHGNYTDGPVYAYTKYSNKYGSPYSEGFATDANADQDSANASNAGGSGSVSASNGNS